MCKSEWPSQGLEISLSQLKVRFHHVTLLIDRSKSRSTFFTFNHHHPSTRRKFFFLLILLLFHCWCYILLQRHRLLIHWRLCHSTCLAAGMAGVTMSTVRRLVCACFYFTVQHAGVDERELRRYCIPKVWIFIFSYWFFYLITYI